MKIWLYKGDDALWARLIEFWTDGKYAHVELQLSPDEFFSSTVELGPRITDFKGLYSQNMADWDIIDLGIIQADGETVRRQVGMILASAGIYGEKPVYNGEGIARNFLPQPLLDQDPEKYFCSQVCTTALQPIGLFLNMTAAMMAPNDMAEWISKHLVSWQGLRFSINEGR